MAIEWTEIERDRLEQLNAGRGNRKGLYAETKRTPQITKEQVIKVKQCLAAGMFYRTVMTETGLSEYHVKGVGRGIYDYLLSPGDAIKYPPNTVQSYRQKESRENMQRIHEYFRAHPGCTIKQAITFIPATKYLVEKYSKHRSEYKPASAQDENGV